MPSAGKTTGRTNQACDNCRRRKTKCDGTRPSCFFCTKRQVPCRWTTPDFFGRYRVLADEPQGTSPDSPDSTPQITGVGSSAVTNSQGLIVQGGLPSRAVLSSLLEIFSKKHHGVHFCSFLNRTSFAIPSLYEQPPFILHSIIALSSLHLENHEVERLTEFPTAQAMSDAYMATARQYSRDLSEKPTISSSQANLILALCEVVTRQGWRAWMHAGLAIRMALTLRLGKEIASNHSFQEMETRRRTFWACLLMDRLLGYLTAPPQSLILDDISTHLPCPEINFMFGEGYHSSPLSTFVPAMDNTFAAVQGVLPYFVVSVTLWGAMTAVWEKGRRHSPLLPTDPESPLFRGTQAIEDWHNNLPSRFRWSPENYAVHRSLGEESLYLNMCFLLQHALCLSHHDYLPQQDFPGIFLDGDRYLETIHDKAGISLHFRDHRLIAICVDSARSIIEMTKVMLAHSETETSSKDLPSMFIGSAVLTAGAVQLWIHYVPGEMLRQGTHKSESQANIDFVTNILDKWAASWKVAQAWKDVFDMLHRLYSMAYKNGEDIISEGVKGTGALFPDVPSEARDLSRNLIQDPISSATGKDDVIAVPNAESLDQTMFDKVRHISRSPLEDADEKSKHLEVFLHTLWQHTCATNYLESTIDE